MMCVRSTSHKTCSYENSPIRAVTELSAFTTQGSCHGYKLLHPISMEVSRLDFDIHVTKLQDPYDQELLHIIKSR